MKSTIVESTLQYDLCVSCGICAAVCPQKCIEFVRKDGQYLPCIDMNYCTKCGMCSDICSAHKVDLDKYYTLNHQEKAQEIYIGNFISCYNAYGVDEALRRNSASGGCITAIVKELLEQGEYPVAFLVDDFNYDNFVQTKSYTKDDSLKKTSKSRYIPISHRNMIGHVLENRDQKIIIVATGCVIHSFLNVIDRYHLNRDNYLILGLFCDKTLNYNIFQYFNDYDITKGNLERLYFRTKEQLGWPGNVKLEYDNGEVVFLPARERMVVKDYFQLERCMYCIDKLCQFADISFGDNYTKVNGEPGDSGSSSIIIRTQQGKNVLDKVKDKLNLFEISMEMIEKSQKIDKRKLNFEYAKMLFSTKGVNIYPTEWTDDCETVKISPDYKNRVHKIHVGREYPTSREVMIKSIQRQKSNNLKKRLKNLIKKLIRK